MAFETILGLATLGIAAVGYLVYSFITSINWPLVWFCMRGDV